MGDLSKNFSRHEFKCPGKNCCGGSAPVHPDLIKALQTLRDLAGVPLKISSGFRCIKHNHEVKGSKNSFHTLGMAADIKVPYGMTPVGLSLLAEEIPAFREGGIGLYATWIHVDVRPYKARW